MAAGKLLSEQFREEESRSGQGGGLGSVTYLDQGEVAEVRPEACPDCLAVSSWVLPPCSSHHQFLGWHL